MAVFVALASLPIALPKQEHMGDQQLALLYKIAERDIPRLATGSSTKSIYVDLDRMQLLLLDQGAVIADIPILSRGRPGTFWETPTGNYSVLGKEPNHFSSIGNVWMPYSMQFFGNFFIHGWPYHDDGEPVPEGYSGGCIRLSTEDAGTVYAFAKKGTPIYVRGNGEVERIGTNAFQYYLRGGGVPPEISAKAFIVADIETGQVLWKRRVQEEESLRGLSSLMSSIVALETVNQYKTVRMSELILGKPIPRDQKGEFQDELPIGSLIYPLMFEGNDIAAKAFAADHGEKNFVRSMNEKALAIGMLETHFASSTGSSENISTANDVFVLLRHMLENKTFLINATMKDAHSISDEDGKEKFHWENVFVKQASTTQYRGGLLTMEEQSGEAALLFSLPLEEFGERKIAFIVLDSRDPKADIEMMKDFVEQHFVYAPTTRSFATVVAEENEPTPSLWGKIRALWKLDFLLRQG